VAKKEKVIVMNIDEKMLDTIYRIIDSKGTRSVLMTVNKFEPVEYRKLQELSDLPSPLTSYYLRRLVRVGIVKKDQRRYFATRVGLQVVRIIQEFENVCRTFDLSDCDADGMIKYIVVRNKGVKK
jgi:predicted methyltransferase